DGWLQDAIHHHYNAGTTSGDWYKGQPDERGIPLSTMRDGTPRGYAFLNIEGNRYTIDYRVAGKSQDYQMEIYSPMVVEQNMNTSAGIYVNFFMGSEYDSVFFRVGKGVWKKMSRISDYDPSYLHLLHEWDFASELPKGRRPSHPVDCHHLWYAPIPVNLPAGEQIIEVKATDLFGRTFTGTGSYRVVVRP
ncbi:MAG: calcineurin-like phosphoesterase C-terminal domain-containing protein, partial [Mangrovibacterium sp.]